MRKVATVYRTGRSFIVHPMERTPPGFWVGAGPRHSLPLDALDSDLGAAALDALRRSREAQDYQHSRAPRDKDLLKAAGYTSRKRFFEESETCELVSELDDLSVVILEAMRKDLKTQSWQFGEPKTVLDGNNPTEVGKAIISALS